MTISLLPSNQTPLERALEQSIIPAQDLRDAIGLIRTAKEQAPDDWLYFLVWEYGLDELLPYLPNPRQALERGLVWQRIKGTPNSIRIALSWLGLNAITLYEEQAVSAHWYEFQIDPGATIDRETLENLVGLCRLSKPMRSRISRVFHNYDIRHGEHDNSLFDGCLFDADSGVYDPDLDIILSIAGSGTSAIAYDQAQLYSAHTTESGSIVWYDPYHHDEIEFDGVLPVDFSSNGITDASVVGLGLGRNILIADGSIRANGLHRANGFIDELPQCDSWGASISVDDDLYGWGFGTWDSRTWDEPRID